MRLTIVITLFMVVGCAPVLVTEQHGLKESLTIPSRDIVKIDTVCLDKIPGYGDEPQGCVRQITFKCRNCRRPVK